MFDSKCFVEFSQVRKILSIILYELRKLMKGVFPAHKIL
jgi:hypothetical protein